MWKFICLYWGQVIASSPPTWMYSNPDLQQNIWPMSHGKVLYFSKDFERHPRYLAYMFIPVSYRKSWDDHICISDSFHLMSNIRNSLPMCDKQTNSLAYLELLMSFSRLYYTILIFKYISITKDKCQTC